MISDLKTLSIVLPCHNEQMVIFDSYEELSNILMPMIGDVISNYELIMVNNGSTDETLEEMLKIQKIDRRIKVIDLRNNFGYQGSISAGLHYANNDMVITIDADLQDDPGKIGEMISKHYEGFDLVLGVRRCRNTDSFLKRHSANIFYKLSNALGMKTVPHHGDFRLISKELLADLRKYKERNRYIRGLVLSLESKYALVQYDRRKRQSGETKFNPFQLIEFAIEGITSFSTAPLKIITLLGLLVFTLSLLSILFILYNKFFLGIDAPGWAFTAIIISLFGGLNSLFIGIVGEYVGKSYSEVKNRPLFVTRKVYEAE